MRTVANQRGFTRLFASAVTSNPRKGTRTGDRPFASWIFYRSFPIVSSSPRFLVAVEAAGPFKSRLVRISRGKPHMRNRVESSPRAGKIVVLVLVALGLSGAASPRASRKPGRAIPAIRSIRASRGMALSFRTRSAGTRRWTCARLQRRSPLHPLRLAHDHRPERGPRAGEDDHHGRFPPGGASRIRRCAIVEGQLGLHPALA